MRTRNRYKFTLTAVLLDEVLFSQQVHPQISDLNMKYTKEANQVYYVPSFDSALTFVETEFDLIVSQDIRVKFSLSMVDTYHIFSTKQMSFMRTDCEIDVNHKLVTVTPKLFNPYKKLIDKRDEEYSVVDMGLEKKTLQMNDFPSWEVYAYGDTSVAISVKNSITLNTITSEPDMAALGRWNIPDGDEDPSGDMGFYTGDTYPKTMNCIAAKFVDNGTEVILKCIRNRFLQVDFNLDPAIYTQLESEDGVYVLQIYFRYLQDVGSYAFKYYAWYRVFKNGSLLTETSYPYNDDPSTQHGVYNSIRDYFGVRRVVNIGSAQATIFGFFIFPRLLSNKEYSESLNYVKLNLANDICASNKRFAKRPTIDFVNNETNLYVVVSSRVSDTNKGYGQVANTNTYYDTPDDVYKYKPAYKDSWWGGVSFWYKYYEVQSYVQSYTAVKVLYDAYLLSDVIKGLLQKIDSSIVFESDAQHSMFFFNLLNPITNASNNTLYVTQKSNVLLFSYDYPAWKAPLKWSQLEELLAHAFNCYTELFYDDSDSAWHLRIEHIKYFLNGHTYSDESTAAVVDLVQAYDGFNREPLSFRTNRWKYDTESQANRYEFSWMDTQSDYFVAAPLIVTDEYSMYEDAKKESCNISWFSSDIDFLTTVPSECSSDGFAILAESNGQSGWLIGSDYTDRQNYVLAFTELIPNFHLYNKYAEKMMIEGTEVLLNVVERKKMRIAEDIQFKVPENVEIQPSNLIKTEAGFAEIDSITIDMTDNSCTATLRYETL